MGVMPGSSEVSPAQPADDVDDVATTRRRTGISVTVALIVAVAVVVAESALYYVIIHHQVGAYSDLLGRVTNFNFLKSSGNIYTHYDIEAFTYPPGGILMLSPIILVPTRLLPAAWSVLVLGALVVTLTIVLRRLTRLNDANAVLIATAVTAVSPFLFSAVYDTIFWGQIGTFLTLAVVADVLLVRGRLQGVLVGLATTVKIYPGVFIVIWLVRRQYRQAATALATVVVTTGVATLLWFPSAKSFLDGKLVHGQELTHLANGFEAQASASIPALFLRPPYFFGQLSVSTSIAIGAVVAVLGIIAAVGAAQRGHELTALVVGLIISVICSPVAWNHYFAFLPLLLFLPWDIGWRSWTTRVAYVALAVNVVPWHRWKYAGANQVLLPKHELYLSYVAQNATLITTLLVVLVATWEFWPDALTPVAWRRATRQAEVSSDRGRPLSVTTQ